jgi:trans-aconitate methyltransferase
MINTLDEHVTAYQGNNLYDFDNQILLTWYSQRVLRNAVRGASLLELGLGHGFSTNIFSGRFQPHVVLEGSAAVIDNFRGRFPDCQAHIVETYFEEFSTTDRFDVIVMGFILEHVDNPLTILDHYREFLSPRGKMFVAVPNAEVLNRRLGHLAGMLDDMTALSDNDRLLGHKRYYTVAKLRDEVERAGYTLERMEGIYLKPFTTRQIVSLQLDQKIIHSLCEVGVSYPELSCGILAELSVP